jgi:hypothetical protein
MSVYDSRHITLDPGLTAIALRGLHEREGHYPFLDRLTRRRRTPRRGRARPAPVATPKTGTASAPFWPRSLSATELFPTFTRLRAVRRPSSAAA